MASLLRRSIIRLVFVNNKIGQHADLFYMGRMKGIEPSSSGPQPNVLTVELHPPYRGYAFATIYEARKCCSFRLGRFSQNPIQLHLLHKLDFGFSSKAAENRGDYNGKLVCVQCL